MKFDGSSGRKPSAEARRYVYAVLASCLADDMTDRGGWVFGGIDSDFDRRRLIRAGQLVVKELLRKSGQVKGPSDAEE
jgi:hypothetical protein